MIKLLALVSIMDSVGHSWHSWPDDWGRDEGAMKTSVGDLISPKLPTTYYH